MEILQWTVGCCWTGAVGGLCAEVTFGLGWVSQAGLSHSQLFVGLLLWFSMCNDATATMLQFGVWAARSLILLDAFTCRIGLLLSSARLLFQRPKFVGCSAIFEAIGADHADCSSIFHLTFIRWDVCIGKEDAGGTVVMVYPCLYGNL